MIGDPVKVIKVIYYPYHTMQYIIHTIQYNGRRGGLVVSAFDSGASAPGSSPGRGHCVVFLGKTLYSHGPSLHLGVSMGTGQFNAGDNPAMD